MKQIILVFILLAGIAYAGDINFVDDFIGVNWNNRIWTSNSTSVGVGAAIKIDDTYANGNILVVSGTNDGAYSQIQTSKNWVDSSKDFVYEVRLRLAATNVSVCKVQMYYNTTNLIMFVCSNSAVAGNWRVVSCNNSTTNTKVYTNSTSVKATISDYVTLKMWRVGSYVRCSIDGVRKAKIPAAKIPTVNLTLIPVYIKTVSGQATKSVYCDYINFTSTR